MVKAPAGEAEAGADRAAPPSPGRRRARASLLAPERRRLDAPTIGLDEPVGKAIVDDVHRPSRDQGVAVPWAIHLIHEVRDGDSVVVLHRGRVRADAAATDVAREHGTGDMRAAFAARIADHAA